MSTDEEFQQESYEETANDKMFAAIADGDLEGLSAAVAAGADIHTEGTVGEEGGITPLMNAAMNGQLELVKYLAECGASVNAKSDSGLSVVFRAVTNGFLDVVKFLVELGANIHDKEPSEEITPIMMAAAFGNVEMFKYLAEQGADIHQGNWYNITPLMYASSTGCVEIVKYLIDCNADPFVKDTTDRDSFTCICDEYDEENNEISKEVVAAEIEQLLLEGKKKVELKLQQKERNDTFLQAVQMGEWEEAQEALKNGADINATTDGRDESALIIACTFGNEEIAANLVAAGAKLDIQDNEGYTAFHRAVRLHDNSIAKLLVCKGCDVNLATKEGKTPALSMLFYFEAFKELVENYHVDLTIGDNNGATCLMHACMDGLDMQVEYLVREKHVNVLATDKNGDTAFSYICKAFTDASRVVECYDRIEAILRSDPATVDIVFDTTEHKRTVFTILAIHALDTCSVDNFQIAFSLGVNINQLDKYGSTLLHNAAGLVGDNSELVQQLINAGANLEIKNHNGDTPLIFAASRGNTNCIRTLIAHNADVNAANAQGYTSAIWSAHSFVKNLEMLKVLCEEGNADLTPSNDMGDTVLTLALSTGHKEMVEYLMKEKKVDTQLVDFDEHVCQRYYESDVEERKKELRALYDKLKTQC